jgi:hypothetical protein
LLLSAAKVPAGAVGTAAEKQDDKEQHHEDADDRKHLHPERRAAVRFTLGIHADILVESINLSRLCGCFVADKYATQTAEECDRRAGTVALASIRTMLSDLLHEDYMAVLTS